MSIAGSTNCSANYLSVSDAYRNTQQNQQKNRYLKEQADQRSTTEFIFKGELLESVEPNNDSTRQKASQTINPANAKAITQYEQTSDINPSKQTSGRVLDAYI